MAKYFVAQHAHRFIVGGSAALFLLLGGTAVAQADSPPHVDHSQANPPPTYPAAAQDAGEQGDVVLGIYVGANGHPTKLHLIQSSGYKDLDLAAAEGVLNWHYVPANRDGDPVSDWMPLTVHYELPKPVQKPQPASAPSQVN